MDSTQIQNYANSSSVTVSGQLAKLIDPEIKIDNPTGKFVLLSVTPSMKDEAIRDRRIPYNAIKNTSRSDGAMQIIQSNYIELEIPKYMFTIKDIKIINHTTHSDGYVTSVTSETKIEYDTFKYGQIFIISNIGGNLGNPKIIGVCNDNK